MNEQQIDEEEDCSCDEWSSGSSYCDSESTIPEWDAFIEPNGQLLFIDCFPKVSHTASESNSSSNFFTKSQARQSTRSKFLRLLRRKNSKRFHKPIEIPVADNKVKFYDHPEGELREVIIKVNNDNQKLGPKNSLVESLLGLTVDTLSDGSRLMISGFDPDAIKHKGIKIGDWLKSINEVQVTCNNLDSVLESFVSLNEVTLKLQQVSGVEVTKHPPINKISIRSQFVQLLTNSNKEHSESLKEALASELVGVLFLKTEGLKEDSPEFEEVLYNFPMPYNKNILCTSRGAFLTLNHLINEMVSSKPHVSSINYKNQLAHVIYVSCGSKLLLFMFPDKCLSVEGSQLVAEEIFRTIEFMYQSLERFLETTSLRDEVDHFFLRVFTRILWPDTVQFSSDPKANKPWRFEDLLLGAKYLILPNEAQMQVDDALSELEASDYREWNEDPLDCQRLFTILGSALYHQGFLLTSHFVHDDLIDVTSFCKQQGLFYLSATEPLKCLVLWKEVFPSSCNRSLPNTESLFKVPEGKRYLLVVGGGKDLLAVLMEAGGCTETPEDNMGPDPFYVEEVEATLSHLKELGISDVADHCLQTNPGSQIVLPEGFCEKKKADFFSSLSKSTLSLNKEGPPHLQKKTEVTSILKRRSSDQGPLYTTGSVLSWNEDNLEDSVSQSSYSEKSEISDEPILGRRATREKKPFIDSPNDDSDIDDYRDGSQASTSSFDLSELRQNLIMESEDMQPMCLTGGTENVLFHYVQFDSTEGVLLLPPPCRVNSQLLQLILDNFHRCSRMIHETFKNTLRFKKMLAENMAKSVLNKSLIAIKEQGTLFELTVNDENPKKTQRISYWVVGRLFYDPHPREVYICYHESVPQNIVEVAYKLSLTLAG
ncbi:protein inturned [Agrilus planipennis]|uniref:Protein inturned n=1 Tax=Agrilus planipennis TaxID=224129 RepID=A0A1W4XFE3_AGRPL|nr:protein inturned [Agrilus planipennis]XP_018331065.1 protein inturned [Agrilus planipennis]